MLNTILFMTFPFIMVYCAFTDLFSMTIHNKASLILIGGFIAVAYLSGMDFQTFLWHWAMFAILLLVGIILFAFKLLGAGDGKLIAATGLWLGWGYTTLEYLLLATMLGGVMSVFILAFRARVLPQWMYEVSWIKRLHTEKDIPYGVALSIGAMLVYPQTPWIDEFIIQKLVT